ncbi:hypothetical protein Tcan_04134 [Toxocara canis]|uniref:Uncharacterized protein n=1 Tax=Toxocara canis TaxID=6265 RepID=A0A0B2VU45_TOXCA|nr:hypothetical protein Tcan_04134 [Toxocara canis]
MNTHGLFSSIIVLYTVSALPQPSRQLSARDTEVLQEIFDSARNGAEKAEIVSRMNAFLKQTMHLPINEMNRKDGMRTVRVYNVRRIGPPFNEFLRREQRQELMEVIKQARTSGASQKVFARIFEVVKH